MLIRQELPNERPDRNAVVKLFLNAGGWPMPAASLPLTIRIFKPAFSLYFQIGANTQALRGNFIADVPGKNAGMVVAPPNQPR